MLVDAGRCRTRNGLLSWRLVARLWGRSLGRNRGGRVRGLLLGLRGGNLLGAGLRICGRRFWGVGELVWERAERRRLEGRGIWGTNKVVLILSKGVTAKRLSVTPAPKPAITVRGPEIFPSASSSMDLYWSKATNPIIHIGISIYFSCEIFSKANVWIVSYNTKEVYIRIPAFKLFPIISVVHPAYHALPNGGHGSFAPAANLRFNCVLVFANSAG